MTSIVEVRVRTATLANTTLRTSYGKNVREREHLFVSIEAGGEIGIGEGSPLPHFSGERAKEMASVTREALGPALIGAEAFDAEGAMQTLDRALPHHHASKAALVSALFDLQGRLVGRPVHDLLGGAVRRQVAYAGAIGIEPLDDVLRRVHDQHENGVRTFKLKVGSEPRRDIDVLRTLRDTFGDEIELRADANGGYTFDEALRFARAVDDVRLQYFEQPLRPGDLRGMARLRSAVTTPIAIDEGLFSVADALEAVRHDAADVFIVKLIKLGGLHAARKVTAIAGAAGIRCVAVSPYETSLGVAANLHLSASSATFPFAAEIGTGVSEVVLPGATGLRTRDGLVDVPEAPGLGVSVDAEFFDEAPAAA